ncbi:glycosyltransferase [Planctomicrobium sp. SH661]|uniref:glycosyltransferase n=1 Tax=Planctomicrobium sp. SH661 TaxID=3448124 RepID=UPI003F5BE351
MRFVTTLTADYAPALHALLASLRANAGIPIEMTVVTYDRIPPADREFADSLGIPLEWIPVESLGRFPEPATRTARMRWNFQKPLIWRLPYREPLLYLDTDILCLLPLTELLEWDDLTVVQKQSSLGRPVDSDPDYLPSGRPVWNAGVFCFRPCDRTLENLMTQARSYSSPVRYGDQVILNDYFNRHEPERVKYAGLGFNMSTWAAVRQPELFRTNPVRLLHFAHAAKPWLHPPEFEWQRPFWDLWWATYQSIIPRRDHVENDVR